MKKKVLPKKSGQVFRNILLPVDLTNRHQAAMDIAAKLIHPRDRVTLLHVIEIIAGLPEEGEEKFYEHLETASRRHMARLVEAMKRRKISCSAVVVRGHRVAEVVRFASDTKVDLIIVTTPPVDHTNVSSGWGSFGYKVALVSPCPVLLMK
jgi:nucleotide-binding universal stress UspA family protein